MVFRDVKHPTAFSEDPVAAMLRTHEETRCLCWRRHRAVKTRILWLSLYEGVTAVTLRTLYSPCKDWPKVWIYFLNSSDDYECALTSWNVGMNTQLIFNFQFKLDCCPTMTCTEQRGNINTLGLRLEGRRFEFRLSCFRFCLRMFLVFWAMSCFCFHKDWNVISLMLSVRVIPRYAMCLQWTCT